MAASTAIQRQRNAYCRCPGFSTLVIIAVVTVLDANLHQPARYKRFKLRHRMVPFARRVEIPVRLAASVCPGLPGQSVLQHIPFLFCKRHVLCCECMFFFFIHLANHPGRRAIEARCFGFGLTLSGLLLAEGFTFFSLIANTIACAFRV